MQAPATSTRPSRTTARPCRRRPTTRTTRSRCSARCWPPRARTSTRRRSSRQQDQLEAALGEYKLASEYDPSNRQARREGRRARSDDPRPHRSRRGPSRRSRQLRERARAASADADPQPGVARAARLPLQQRQPPRHPELHRRRDRHQHHATTARSPDRPTTVQLDGVTLEQALNQIMTMNQLVVQGAERAVDLRLPGHAAEARAVRRAGRSARSTSRTPTRPSSRRSSARSSACRASPCSRRSPPTRPRTRSPSAARRRWSQILEKIIEQNDKPRAEIVVDVEILEVNRKRAKSYGLNLSEYALGGVFSPEVSPSGTTTRPTGTGDRPARRRRRRRPRRGTSTAPSGVKSPPPFNLNTISRGVSTADFYLAVPTAIVRFLETDTQHEAHRQAAAARRGRHEADAEARRRRFRSSRPATRRSRPAAPASNPLSSYQLQGRRREHRHDAARHARRRHHPRPDASRTARAGPRRHHRRRRTSRRSASAR